MKINETLYVKITSFFNIFISLILFFLCVFISMRLLPFAYDDAYIHFRIAENFAQYGKPYFNISDKVMATSSFVWTSLLSMFALFKLNLPKTVAIFNSLVAVFGSLVWINLFPKTKSNFSYLILSIFFQILYVFVLLPSLVGLMETPFAILILGLSINLIIRKRKIGWVLLAVTIFLRYELIIFAIALIILELSKNTTKSNKLKNITSFMSTIILFCLILMFYYSSIFPNTISAKNIVYQINFSRIVVNFENAIFLPCSYPFLGIITRGKILQEGFCTLLSSYWYWISVFIIFLSILVFPLKKYFHSIKLGLLFFLCSLGLIFAYLYKHVFLFDWYIPLFEVPLIFSLYYFLLSLFFKEKSVEVNTFQLNISKFTLYVAILILCLTPIRNFINYFKATENDLSNFSYAAPGLRVQRYLEVGEELYRLFPNSKLLTSEIGGLGYSFRGYIIDGIGLITPSALIYHPMNVPDQRQDGAIGAIPADLVKDTLPELIVSYPVFIKEFMTTKICKELYTKIEIPAFSSNWQSRTGLNSLWGSEKLFIYIRNDIVNEGIINKIQHDIP